MSLRDDYWQLPPSRARRLTNRGSRLLALMWLVIAVVDFFLATWWVAVPNLLLVGVFLMQPTLHLSIERSGYARGRVDARTEEWRREHGGQDPPWLALTEMDQ